ncbi:MAG: hypothetical protein ACXW1P_06870 [Methylophilaceae bacterium]
MNLDIDVSWKKGEKRKHKVYESSGLNSTIADTKTPRELVKAVIDFANICKAKNISLATSCISTELDIGIGVGYSEQFIASIIFLPSELNLLSSVGIALSITAYPTSDESSDNENT